MNSQVLRRKKREDEMNSFEDNEMTMIELILPQLKDALELYLVSKEGQVHEFVIDSNSLDVALASIEKVLEVAK